MWKTTSFSVFLGNSLRSNCFPILDTPTFLYRDSTVVVVVVAAAAAAVVGEHPTAVGMNIICSVSTRNGQRFYDMLG